MEIGTKASDAEGRGLAAAYTDKSVLNLSSLIVLAGMAERRMLLPGDARVDDIMAGLQSAKLLRSGTCHVDVLKLTHHGSNRDGKNDVGKRLRAFFAAEKARGRRYRVVFRKATAPSLKADLLDAVRH